MELVKTYTSKEVKTVMFSININQSPGLDVYESIFFKETLNVIGDNITQAVLQFLENGKLLKQINATIISLIPKEHVP